MWRKIKNVYHLGTAVSANVRFGYPSRKLTVIGVTGTDGKTTTVNLVYHILSQAGLRVSMISTIGAIIGGQRYDTGFHVTNPSSWPLQKLIKIASEVNDYLVLEVTSHGLDQYRVYGIPFTIGVLTNISHEHLDYHKTYEKYVDAKVKLLIRSKVVIINRDDKSYESISSKLKSQSLKSQVKISSFAEASAGKQKFITYGLTYEADVNPEKFSFKSNLIGEFNKYNCLAAISACRELGVDDNKIREALMTFIAPIGRGDVVYDKEFKVMIDFAHTPNAFEQLLSGMRKLTTGRIIHVFGSAGQRDSSKRQFMGQTSAKYADIIILTADDPRNEQVEKIMDDIEEGITNQESRIKNENIVRDSKKLLFKISDRKKAIEFAIYIAEKGDLVLLTGKGHEKSMNHGNGEEPWDEYRVVKESLAKRSSL